MRNSIIIGILIFLLVTCNKQDDKKLLTVDEFELGECFSTLSLSDAEVVITDEQSYIEFQDSIRRHFNPSCDTIFLPEINFEESFFLGKYTLTSGCSAQYNRQVYYNDKYDEYEYHITVTSLGDCEMLVTSFNSVVVPKQSGSTKVTFYSSVN